MTPGAPAEIAPTVYVFPDINRISVVCRKTGALNVLIQNSISDESKTSCASRRSGTP